jgi:hypothetical protein
MQQHAGVVGQDVLLALCLADRQPGGLLVLLLREVELQRRGNRTRCSPLSNGLLRFMLIPHSWYYLGTERREFATNLYVHVTISCW